MAFDEVKVVGHKHVKCECGFRVARRKEFAQVCCPANRNVNNEAKSRAQIYAELSATVKAWKAEPETCYRCVERAKNKEKEVEYV